MIHKFEICANSAESCLAALEGGADRAELCAGIPEGGTTPSAGEIAAARELIDNSLRKDFRLNVIIRPRGGDFLYSSLERKIMLRDIAVAKDLGADGIVVGALERDGSVDIKLMEELAKAAEGLQMTFHRAFDMCARPYEALEELISLGFRTVLTSGQRVDAWEGIPLIRELVRQARGRISVMAGCGVNEKNIAEIAEKTGVEWLHFSARETFGSEMIYRNAEARMDRDGGVDEYARGLTTAKRVRRIIDAL